MMTPPTAAKSYDIKILSEEHRDGYVARKIEFNLSDYYRVKAYLLIPDGKGPFPAINLLHDHGAHLFIGKEKMIMPFDEDSSVIADARQWCDKLYGGQFFGDYLAKMAMSCFLLMPLYGENAVGRKVLTEKI